MQIVESNFQFQDVFSIICNTCRVDKAKVIKHWYAKPARSDISIAELFSQLRDGDIDGRSIDKKYIGCQVLSSFVVFL